MGEISPHSCDAASRRVEPPLARQNTASIAPVGRVQARRPNGNSASTLAGERIELAAWHRGLGQVRPELPLHAHFRPHLAAQRVEPVVAQHQLVVAVRLLPEHVAIGGGHRDQFADLRARRNRAPGRCT